MKNFLVSLMIFSALINIVFVITQLLHNCLSIG